MEVETEGWATSFFAWLRTLPLWAGIGVILLALLIWRGHLWLDPILKHRQEMRRISAKVAHDQERLRHTLQRRLERTKVPPNGQ